MQYCSRLILFHLIALFNINLFAYAQYAADGINQAKVGQAIKIDQNGYIAYCPCMGKLNMHMHRNNNTILSIGLKEMTNYRLPH